MVLYELLVGAVMYDVFTFPALCMAIVNDPAVPLRTRRPDAPEALEAVLLRCAEKDPNQRFSSALELALALAPFGPPEATRIATRMARRSPSGVAPTLTWAAPPTWPPAEPSGADSTAPPTLPSWRCPPHQGRSQGHNYLIMFLAATLSVVCGGAFAWRMSRRHPLPDPATSRVEATPSVALPSAAASPMVSYDELPRAPLVAPTGCALPSTNLVPSAPAAPPAGSGSARATPVSSTFPAKRHRAPPRPTSSIDDVTNPAILEQH